MKTIKELRHAVIGASPVGLSNESADKIAQAVIDAFLEGVGGVPSVGECINLVQFTGSINTSSIEAVRTAILAAVAKKLKTAENSVKTWMEHAGKADSALAAVRALPEKWRKDDPFGSIGKARRQEECAQELTAALNAPQVMDKEREAFETHARTRQLALERHNG